MLYINLICAPIREDVSLRYQEKPKRAYKGDHAYPKLNIKECIWYGLVGYFWGLETFKKFPCKFMVNFFFGLQKFSQECSTFG